MFLSAGHLDFQIAMPGCLFINSNLPLNCTKARAFCRTWLKDYLHYGEHGLEKILITKIVPLWKHINTALSGTKE